MSGSVNIEEHIKEHFCRFLACTDKQPPSPQHTHTDECLYLYPYLWIYFAICIIPTFISSLNLYPCATDLVNHKNHGTIERLCVWVCVSTFPCY